MKRDSQESAMVLKPGGWVCGRPAEKIRRRVHNNEPAHGLASRPVPNLEFSLVVQNLLQENHPEFCPGMYINQTYEVRRSAYVKITWRL
jgi:hypothetical protein